MKTTVNSGPSIIKIWVVYMLFCDDGTIYSGITNDLQKRVATHNSGKGAKYTKTRLPVRLAAYWECEDRSHASKEEYKNKKLTRAEKLQKIQDYESINKC